MFVNAEKTLAEIVKQAAVDVISNLSKEKPSNSTEKKPSSAEGVALAYGSLVIMAILPIIFGSIRSVKVHKSKKVSNLSLLIK